LTLGTVIRATGCADPSASTAPEESLGEVAQAISGARTYLYQHCDYTGYSVGLLAGDYTLAQIQGAGLLNDDLSSLQVPTGYEIELFQHDNFAGFSTVLTGDTRRSVAGLLQAVASARRRVSGPVRPWPSRSGRAGRSRTART